ncbi:MAG: 3'-5' exonuclease [Clostridium sp.]|nr:3'-5' exonuclease [Clostridium sp.]
MIRLIFDTETTGLDSYINQIAQLSYVIIDRDCNIEVAKNFYFAVEYVEEGATRVTGLTKEGLDKLSGGKIFKNYAEEIYQDFLKSNILIAHNLSFDLGFIKMEFKRLGYDVDVLFESKEKCCTMYRYTDILQIPHYYFGYKFPKLEEVIDYVGISFDVLEEETINIFNVEGEIGYHDSRYDVISTMYIYKYLKQNYKINIHN